MESNLKIIKEILIILVIGYTVITASNYLDNNFNQNPIPVVEEPIDNKEEIEDIKEQIKEQEVLIDEDVVESIKKQKSKVEKKDYKGYEKCIDTLIHNGKFKLVWIPGCR